MPKHNKAFTADRKKPRPLKSGVKYHGNFKISHQPIYAD